MPSTMAVTSPCSFKASLPAPAGSWRARAACETSAPTWAILPLAVALRPRRSKHLALPIASLSNPVALSSERSPSTSASAAFHMPVPTVPPAPLPVPPHQGPHVARSSSRTAAAFLPRLAAACRAQPVPGEQQQRSLHTCAGACARRHHADQQGTCCTPGSLL